MAGFEVIIYGRFWVITEVQIYRDSREKSVATIGRNANECQKDRLQIRIVV